MFFFFFHLLPPFQCFSSLPYWPNSFPLRFPLALPELVVIWVSSCNFMLDMKIEYVTGKLSFVGTVLHYITELAGILTPFSPSKTTRPCKSKKRKVTFDPSWFLSGFCQVIEFKYKISVPAFPSFRKQVLTWWTASATLTSKNIFPLG